MDLALGIAIPFIGTSMGALMVFFMKNQINPKVEKTLLGFASGVMIAASVWSLIIPAIEMAEEQGVIGWIPATIGFILGIIFLMIIDVIVPHLENNVEKGIKTFKLNKTTMLVLAVTLHNVPEGMAVRCRTCKCINTRIWDYYGSSTCVSNWNRYSKLSRRSNYINATKK